MRPSTSLSPQQATSQNHAQKSPTSLSVLKLAAQTDLHLPWNRLLWVSVSILLRQLSPSGSGACCSQPPWSGLGKHVLCYTGSWWGSGRHTFQGSGFSVCPPEKPKYLLSHSKPHGSFSWRTLSYTRPLSQLPTIPFKPAWLLLPLFVFILNARTRISCVTSNPAPPGMCCFC